MKRRALQIFFLIGFAALISSCSKDVTIKDPGAKYKGKTEKQIYMAGRKALFSGDWQECSQHFEGLLSLYPFGKYGQDAQLDNIFCYYENDDVGMTLASSDRYIQLYPMSRYTGYAYYMRGLAEFYRNRSFLDQHYSTDYAQRNLETLRKAFLDFNHVIRDYPGTRYAPDARRRMVYIRNMIALHNLEVAKFYFKRHAYVGAANRANLVIKHFQQSTPVPDALVMMALSYQKLGLPKSAAQAITVLQINFPQNRDLPKLLAQQRQLLSHQA